MARMTIWNMSREDDDVLDNVSSTEVNITSDIGEQTNAMEFVEEANGVEQDIVTFEESEEAVKELEDQVVENEGMLENNPENITEEIVAVAQEKYFITAAKLGYPMEEIMRNRISIESAKESPVQALRLATEDIKQTAGKMIEALKNLFQKIVEGLRKMIAKGISFFSGVVGKAQELKKKIINKNLQPKLNENNIQEIYSMMPYFFGYNNGNFDVKVIMGFINHNFLKDLFGSGTNFKEFENESGGYDQNKFKSVGSAGAFLYSIANAHSEELKNMNNNYVIYEAYKQRIGVVVNADVGIDTMMISLDMQNFKMPNDIPALKDQKSLIEILDAVITNDKTKKQYMDGIYQTQDNMAKFISKISSDSDVEDRAMLRSFRNVGSKLAYACIMQYINTNKNLVTAVSKVIEETKINTKQEAMQQSKQPQQ